jgi:hypothetical protein
MAAKQLFAFMEAALHIVSAYTHTLMEIITN